MFTALKRIACRPCADPTTIMVIVLRCREIRRAKMQAWRDRNNKPKVGKVIADTIEVLDLQKQIAEIERKLAERRKKNGS